MQKFDPCNGDYRGIINSIKNGIALAKLENTERHFASAISTLDKYISLAEEIRKSHPREYSDLLNRLYEIIGDSYFAIKKYDIAFSCYLAAYKMNNRKALNKVLYLAKIHGHHFSSDNALVGFLFLLSTNNEFPGKRRSNSEFSEKVINLTSLMSLELQLYRDLYFTTNLIVGSVSDNSDREDQLLNSAVTKYGFDSVNGALKNFNDGKTIEFIVKFRNEKFSDAYEKFISSKFLSNSNQNIYDECRKIPEEYKLKRLKCASDFFWRNIDADILNRTLSEDINLKFKFASVVNSLIGHPAVKREVVERVGLYSDSFSPLNEKRFDVLFSHSANVDKVRVIYRKLPIS